MISWALALSMLRLAAIKTEVALIEQRNGLLFCNGQLAIYRCHHFRLRCYGPRNQDHT